ncbi:hypothetical protein D3C86_2058990 [compost metagenome]
MFESGRETRGAAQVGLDDAVDLALLAAVVVDMAVGILAGGDQATAHGAGRVQRAREIDHATLVTP